MKYAKIALLAASLALLVVAGGASAAQRHHAKKCPTGKHRNGAKCVKNPTAAARKPGTEAGTGPAGSTGSAGSKGETGSAGSTGAPGTAGAPGAEGKQGAEGLPGAPAPTGLSSWGELVRNEYGSPTARVGTTSPVSPDGDGALILATADGTEKAEMGTETEFAGKPFSSIGAVSFEEFVTDGDLSVNLGNEPDIQMEVNPKIGGKTYSSLVYQPGPLTALQANAWRTVDASAPVTDHGSEGWYFSNSTVASTTNCSQAHLCSQAEVEAEAPETEVSYSVGLGKGRDYQFQGFVDNLKVFGATYDFTSNGVFKK